MTDSKLDINQLSEILGYTVASENWIRLEHPVEDPATAYLYRRAKEAGASHAYVFRTCPPDMPILPARPAVYVASAKDEAKADDIHRKLWLLGNAPFIVVILPEQVRVYTGFQYRKFDEDADVGQITSPRVPDLAPQTIAAIREALSNFHADEIDSGRIWQQQVPNLKVENRVDQRLLNNLQQLGDALVSDEYGLSSEVAHSLIGKYIYIRYLKDRKILSTEWLEQRGISLEDALGRKATLNGLSKLVEALEDRFNGKVFPLPFEGSQAPNDDAVKYVANIFAGDQPDGQLAFDFCIYDFSFIPIELLSSIYEQFLRRQEDVNKIGAYYTPEIVADYLVSELNYVKPLQPGMNILDPCCGSGIFLVLAYRRLIELQRMQHKTENKPDLSPYDLREILITSIYGVERKLDACYVTEFSLLLTLLSYVDPPELHRYEDFKFPQLHNTHIFKCDFFDDNSLFWQDAYRFDWVVGNPPWVELELPPTDSEDLDAPAREWIEQAKEKDSNDKNKTVRIVNRGRVSDAFCWRATEVLKPEGCVGLYIPAKTLTNGQCTPFRKAFFTQNTVRRITNFSNLAYILFAGRARHPAATIVFGQTDNQQDMPEIAHYGPFVINQVPDRSLGHSNDQVWSITIYENEIKAVSPLDAASGDPIVWKTALWGTHRDSRILSRLQRLFPWTLDQMRVKQNWSPLRLGLQLRSSTADEKVDNLPALASLQLLKPEKMTASGFRFSVPEQAFESIPTEMQNVREGRDVGLEVAYAPHLFLTINFAAFSETNFVLPHPHIGLSVPSNDADYLRALSVLLSSSTTRYLLFFKSPSWGILTSTIGVNEARSLPVPVLTQEQVRQLAALHKELSNEEQAKAQLKSAQTSTDENTVSEYVVPNQVSEALQTLLDDQVEQILNLPTNIRIIIRDFMEYRYQFVQGKHKGSAIEEPSDEHLLKYGRTLAHSLDVFVGADNKKHEITLARLEGVILCQTALVQANFPIEPVILEFASHNAADLEALWQSLKQRFSQWVYIQRSLRVFDGAKVQLFKPARLIDWTRTQALLDSDDIIGEVLSRRTEVK